MNTVKSVVKYLNILIFAPHFSWFAWAGTVGFFVLWDLGYPGGAIGLYLGAIVGSNFAWRYILNSWRETHNE